MLKLYKEIPILPETSQQVVDIKDMFALRRQAESRGDSEEVLTLTRTIKVMEEVLEYLVGKQKR